MRTPAQRLFAALGALGALALALSAGCADHPDPVAPVGDDDLPNELTVTLETSSLDSPSVPILRTLTASLVSPHDLPLHGLKWPRLELSEDADWPSGWRVLPGDLPFSAATGGVPGGRRFTWKMSVLRTSASAPTEGEVCLWLEYAAAPGGPAIRARSAPVHIEFAPEADPHPVTERDLRDSNDNVFLLVLESWPWQGPRSNSIEIRPDGSFRGRSGAAAADDDTETNGVLTESQRTRLGDALVDGRAWALLDSEADADPRPNESYINVVLVVGDASAIQRGGESSFRSSADWLKISGVLTELTRVEIPAK